VGLSKMIPRCSVRHDERRGPFRAIMLGNERLAVDVLRGLGGWMWTFLGKRRGEQWLWRKPGVDLWAVGWGADYDDNWIGGWDEVFPNDAPGDCFGRRHPDNGE